MPTLLQLSQGSKAWYILLRLRYVFRTISDHAEVSHNFLLSHTNRLPYPQGVCRDGEEPLDRLFAVLHEFRTGRLRDGHFDPLRVASRYDLPPIPLNQISEANPNFESDGISRLSF